MSSFRSLRVRRARRARRAMEEGMLSARRGPGESVVREGKGIKGRGGSYL